MKGGSAFHIIGCVMFSADHSGIWVNWIGISKTKYDSIRFGQMAPNMSFRRTGLGLFLLKLVQLQSAGFNWSTDIHLQANQGTVAVNFYKKIGFQKMKSNNFNELPKEWQDITTSNMYIKFVDDATNVKEAEEIAKRDNTPYSTDYFLHLFKLTGKLMDNQEILKNASLLPKAGKSMFLSFPFIELGQRLDHSTKNLLIYGHPFFMFLDQTSFLQKLDVNTEYTFENVVIETYLYKILKNDNGNYKEYLHSSHLGLTMQWMLRNSDSVVSNSFEIVRDDFIRTVTHFYDCMMTTKGNINSYENAYIIHKYLMKKHSIIQSRFIFFGKLWW